MKRYIAFASAFILFIIVTVCAVGVTRGDIEQVENVENYLPELSGGDRPEIHDTNSSDPNVNSSESTVPVITPPENPPTVRYPKKAEVFYNVTDNTLVESKNADAYIAPASLLKLLTASVALKYVDPGKVITVGTELELVPPGSSLCLIAKGHRLTLYDLLTGMLLASGNDAAYTVAVSTAREVSGCDLDDREAVGYFTNLMNSFARELGMTDSYFVNPDGSDDDRQFTTANDLLLLARYALTVPGIREIAGTHQKYVVFASGHNITWTNSNKLLDPENKFFCADAIGLKTGTTERAGCNLIAAFNKNGDLYIAIAIGCKSDDARYKTVTEYYSKA